MPHSFEPAPAPAPAPAHDLAPVLDPAPDPVREPVRLPASAAAPRAGALTPELPMLTLWYRFMFFDWLFRDLNAARDRIERHAMLQHNVRMCRYLPTYLRRWSFLTLFGFALGCLFERATQASMVSAWFFTWSCVTLTGMVVISVAWARLANARMH